MPISRTGNWVSSLSCEITATFTTPSAMRYFFNSGGRVRFSSTRSGGDATSQNSIWSDTLSAAGTQSFGATGSGSGSINFWNLTTTNQEWYRRTSTSPYSSNFWSISARLGSGVANTSSITATSIIFTILWSDGYTDTGPSVPENPPPGDLVNGTITLTVDEQYSASPSGIALLPTVPPPGVQPVWTVPRPTYSATAISGS